MNEPKEHALPQCIQDAAAFLVRERKNVHKYEKMLSGIWCRGRTFPSVGFIHGVGPGLLTLWLTLDGTNGLIVKVPGSPKLPGNLPVAFFAHAAATVLHEGGFCDVLVGVVDEHCEGVLLDGAGGFELHSRFSVVTR